MYLPLLVIFSFILLKAFYFQNYFEKNVRC
jgi:hypothetical protein